MMFLIIIKLFLLRIDEIQRDNKNNRKNGGEDTRNNISQHKRHIVQHTINARECCRLSD
jgi:hypothetical protein|nr:MAG TPA: hypothetical protein [Crassvirales sp.]